MKLPDRWGCGCDANSCHLRIDAYRDASADPSQTVRIICMTHGLSGDSDAARVSAHRWSQQQDQALQQLDLAHQEQCR
jgi:hypothetical protein